MIRAKNIDCFLRSIDRREAGQMTTEEGQIVKWNAGYKLELDIYDPEEDVQKNKLRTCTMTLEDNEINAKYYEKLRYLVPMTPFKADVNVVLPKREGGIPKIALDRIHLQSLEPQKTK